MSNIVGSMSAFVEEGIYQRLDCGCVMHAHEIVPLGPCMCLVYHDGECELSHEVSEFMPLRLSAAAARAAWAAMS